MAMKPPKHPNRERKTHYVWELEKNLYAHLKKGKIYRMRFHVTMWHREYRYLYKTCSIEGDQRIGVIEDKKLVMYLGMEQHGHLFHKVVYGDQVGYVAQSTGLRFQRITKRMLEREEQRMMEAQGESEGEE